MVYSHIMRWWEAWRKNKSRYLKFNLLCMYYKGTCESRLHTLVIPTLFWKVMGILWTAPSVCLTDHPSVCPLCYLLLLNHWAEFHETCYITSPHGKGVQENIILLCVHLCIYRLSTRLSYYLFLNHWVEFHRNCYITLRMCKSTPVDTTGNPFKLGWHCLQFSRLSKTIDTLIYTLLRLASFIVGGAIFYLCEAGHNCHQCWLQWGILFIDHVSNTSEL